MNKKNIVVFGISKIADIVYNNILDDPNCNAEIVAFCVDSEYYSETKKNNIPIVRFEDVNELYPPDENEFFVAIGYHAMNSVRELKCKEAREKGYSLASFVASNANVSSTVKIGENVLILNGVNVGAYSEIGDNTCIYSGATVSHHCIIKNNVWITSGTVVGGNSTIGHNCFLGINSTIGHNVIVGNNNFIGAGTVINKNTVDDSVYIIPDTPKYRLSTSQFIKLFKFN